MTYDYIELIDQLSVRNERKIVFLIMDGLGGAELQAGGRTELETARTPNMDALAAEGTCGLLDPIAPGFTPGSGPAHLSLFGYDPVKNSIGRGILAAAGIGFDLDSTDVAARGNFCTKAPDGTISDRRAGRIPTEKNAELCRKLEGIEIDGIKIFINPVKDYRCSVVFRGDGLEGKVSDTDPQQVGKEPLEAKALDPGSEKTAAAANKLVAEVGKRLEGLDPANFMLLRGFDSFPDIPRFTEFTKMRSASIAVYPDYKGITRIIGMDVLDTGDDVPQEIDTFKQVFEKYDFCYIHVKKTDSYGEDGNFDGKVHLIEEVDKLVPEITAQNPDVLVITGDHSTPALIKSHSWHPLPVLLRSPLCRRDATDSFGENACATGGLGRMPSVSLLPVAMANAMKLLKFGA